MVRDTSIEAYHRLLESGGLTAKYKQILSILSSGRQMTANQICRVIASADPDRQLSHQNIHTALGALRDSGAVRMLPEKVVDEVSEHKNYLWEVTGYVPDKIAPRQRKKKSEKVIIASLKKHLAWATKAMNQKRYLSLKEPTTKQWAASSERVLKRLAELGL